MANTKRQKERERIALLIESFAGKNPSSAQLWATNRHVEKRKREQYRKAADHRRRS